MASEAAGFSGSTPFARMGAVHARPVLVSSSAALERWPTLDAFYRENLPFVWRNARRLAGANTDVDDIVQEVFLVAMRRLSEFEGRSTIQTWLFAILRNVVLEHHRRRKQQGSREARDSRAELEMEELFNSHDIPDRIAEQSQAMQLVYGMLDKLDAPKREVFVLVELEQMSAPEVAEAIGEPLTTVYARLRDARKIFQTEVTRHRARTGRGHG